MSSVAEILGPGGIISQRLSGYESRPQQLEMAERVEQALTSRQHCIVEAGTGTGKSLAYLIPAILSGQRVVVSTAGKALQEQLAQKDIPFLQSVLPVPFTAAVLKGRSNYLCLYAWERLQPELQESAIKSWLQTTESGDMESLPFQASGEDLTATSDTCLGKHCPNYNDCFAERAKARAAQAQVVIVNHTLLTIDLVLRDASDDHATAIPDRDVVVIDEVHSLEQWCTSAFTKEISAAGVARLARDRFLERVTINQDRLTDVEYRAESFFVTLLALQPDKYTTTFTLSAPPERLLAAATSLVSALSSLQWEVARSILKDDAGPESESLKRKYLSRIEGYAEMVRGIFDPSDNHVVYVEVQTGRNSKKFAHLLRSPISVAADLRRTLFDRWPTVCTSATIAVGRDFGYLKERCGIAETSLGEPVELVVGSPFDYRSHALLYLPKDGVSFDPTRYYRDGSIEYYNRLAKEIEQLLLASDGRAFCLFTSNKALNEVYNRIAHRLRWLVLKQGDVPRPELVKRFKQSGTAVLFALKSFWEGIDIAGDALSLVVIDKIPFSPPDEPVYAARCDQLNRQRGDRWAWFSRLALPDAIIQLKQGFGRLVRTKSDRGVVAILDGRMTVKSYGTQVVRALPPAVETRDIEAVRVFFEQKEAV